MGRTIPSFWMYTAKGMYFAVLIDIRVQCWTPQFWIDGQPFYFPIVCLSPLGGTSVDPVTGDPRLSPEAEQSQVGALSPLSTDSLSAVLVEVAKDHPIECHRNATGEPVILVGPRRIRAMHRLGRTTEHRSWTVPRWQLIGGAGEGDAPRPGVRNPEERLHSAWSRVQPGCWTVLTVKQAAKRMGVSVATVYPLCANRCLRHTRIGLGRGKIV